MNEKECLACEKIKPIEDFHRRLDSADGRRSNCKLCRKNNKKRNKNPKTKRCSNCLEVKPNNDLYFYRQTKQK